MGRRTIDKKKRQGGVSFVTLGSTRDNSWSYTRCCLMCDRIAYVSTGRIVNRYIRKFFSCKIHSLIYRCVKEKYLARLGHFCNPNITTQRDGQLHWTQRVLLAIFSCSNQFYQFFTQVSKLCTEKLHTF